MGSSALETFLLFFREDIITVAPQDGIAEVGETSQLSKDEAVIGNRTSCTPSPRQETVEFVVFFTPNLCKQGIRRELHTTISPLSMVD